MGNKNSIRLIRPFNDFLSGRSRFFKLFMPFVICLFLNHGSQSVFGQASNSDFEKIKIGEAGFIFSGLDRSPDGNTVAFTEKQSSALKIVDWKNRRIVNEFKAGGWSAGSRISYSNSGKYILLQQLNYVGLVENKIRKIGFEIIDAASGKQIRLFENVQDVVISNDEKYALSLNNGEVIFWNLPDGSRGKSFTVPGAGNAIDITPDNRIIAVSHSITKEYLLGDSRYYKKKKAVKFAVKYKQLISLYDGQRFNRIKTIVEPYDIIYKLKFSPDGRLLFAFQNPHLKAQVSQKALTYINQIDMDTKEPVRLGFTSQAISQPEIKLSNNQKMFALNSRGNRFQEIHLYDFESGTLLKRFELGYRLFEKSDGEKFVNDSRPSFVFLPGDQSILIAIGNRMILWNLEFNQ